MRRALFVGLSALYLFSCNDGSDGERLGTFTVLATRTRDACGAQMGAEVARAEYDVVLSVNRGLLQWRRVGGASATGSFDVYQRSFRLSQEQDIQAIQADRRYAYPGCVLRRNDVMEGLVSATANGADAGLSQGADAGSTISGFRGTETIVYGTQSGDCSPLIGATEGQVLALPCSMTYEITATRTGP